MSPCTGDIAQMRRAARRTANFSGSGIVLEVSRRPAVPNRIAAGL
jgi:hypothetical protein